MKPTYILGLNTFHADSSAVLVREDGLWRVEALE